MQYRKHIQCEIAAIRPLCPDSVAPLESTADHSATLLQKRDRVQADVPSCLVGQLDSDREQQRKQRRAGNSSDGDGSQRHSCDMMQDEIVNGHRI